MYDVATIGGGLARSTAAASLAQAKRGVILFERETLFRRYERAVNRAKDFYLRFVNAWYTKDFIEVFIALRDVLGLPSVVNAVLDGNIGNYYAIRWRMWMFYFLVWLQRRYPIVPWLTLVPKKEELPAPSHAVRATS